MFVYLRDLQRLTNLKLGYCCTTHEVQNYYGTIGCKNSLLYRTCLSRLLLQESIWQ